MEPLTRRKEKETATFRPPPAGVHKLVQVPETMRYHEAVNRWRLPGQRLIARTFPFGLVWAGMRSALCGGSATPKWRVACAHSPPPMVPPGLDSYTGGLSAAVFQRLAFSPGNPLGSHPGGPVGNCDSISEPYPTASVARVDSFWKPENPLGGFFWPEKPLSEATIWPDRQNTLIPRHKMD